MKNSLLRFTVGLLVLSLLGQSSSVLAGTKQYKFPESSSLVAAQTPTPPVPSYNFEDEYIESKMEAERQRILEEHLTEDGLPEELVGYGHRANPSEKREYVPPSEIVIAQTKAQVDSFSCATVTDVPQIECQALVALYQCTNGAGWTHQDNWLVTNTINDWYGIGVLNGYIVDIILNNNNLNGVIPPELNNIHNLYYLNLAQNRLTGSIPTNLRDLNLLISLDLSRNDLTGNIPKELGYLISLERLNLSINNINHVIPEEIANLTNLVYLNLTGNQLSGIIPSGIKNLVNLQSLYLDHNQFTGSIPSELDNIYLLYYLDLSYNNLTGNIPQNLGNLNNLLWLNLSGNKLTGNIPSGLGNLDYLYLLALDANRLTGNIPTNLSNIVNLRFLSLSTNLLTGNIPMELGRLNRLVDLDICGNLLTGNIPIELGNIINLERLCIGNNQLSGTIPSDLARLSNLTNLILENNELMGSIPIEFGNFDNLYHMFLSSNQLTGNIPPQLGNLTDLEILDISNNHLYGNIPPELGNLNTLTSLHLEFNQLIGNIPIELYDLNRLEILHLNNNQLNMNIPADTGRLSNLFELYLDNNQFNGNIPIEIASLEHLEKLHLNNNHLVGDIPLELGNLSNLQELYLGDNQLDGNIPLNFINLTSLKDINYYNTSICQPSVPEFLTWKATVDAWQGTNMICESVAVQQKFLVVPLNWQGTQKGFIDAASIQLNNFIDHVPLYDCKSDQLLIKYLDVHNQNFNSFTCSEYALYNIRNFVINELKVNASDWDVIIGFTEYSPCPPVMGQSDGIHTIWSSNEASVVISHELGHIYGFSDQYCSNQAGSIDTRCNDGDLEGDIWLGGDPNFLDADLPFDCPPDGSFDHNGSRCCNISSQYNCANVNYGICCYGNKNFSGGRSTMSFADAPEPRGFDDYEMFLLSEKPELNCVEAKNPYQQNSTSIVNKIPGFVLNLNLSVYNDDSVEEEAIAVSRGRPTATSILARLSGNYTLQILDAAQNELLYQPFSLYYDYMGPVFEGVDYSGITYDVQSVSFRFTFSNAMERLNLYHNGTLIFAKELPNLYLNYLPVLNK